MAASPPRLPVPANAPPAPLYAQVKQMIAQQIRSGAWPANYRVPSEAELVEELGFSRMTINRALRELTSEGLLVRMQGVGTFVAQPKARSALFAVLDRHEVGDTVRLTVYRDGATSELELVLQARPSE